MSLYSPIKQQTDQDPAGVFVRRWVPELDGVPDEYLAIPSQMPAMTQHLAGCVVGQDYPEPIVEHKRAYAEAKKRIFAHRSTPEARHEARRVYQKHGSRRRPGQQESRSRPSDDRGGAEERSER